jgi:hypothetical protein
MGMRLTGNGSVAFCFACAEHEKANYYMTIKTPQQGEAAEALLLDARQLYADINHAHKAGLKKLADSEDKEVRAFSTLAQLHWKSLQTVMERQNDLNRINREQAGIVHGYAVDLDAARSEVGRRLACLKDAGTD